MRLAHKFAIESEHITADMVEAIEFPHLANKYSVYGVPRTVINESVHQEGAVPEPMLLAKLLEAVGMEPPPPAHAHAHEHAHQHEHAAEEEWDDEEEWEEEDWDEEDDEEWDDEDWDEEDEEWDEEDDEEWDDED